MGRREGPPGSWQFGDGGGAPGWLGGRDGAGLDSRGGDSRRAVARACSVVSAMAAPPLVPVVVSQALALGSARPPGRAVWLLPLAGAGLLVGLVGPVAVVVLARRSTTREADGDVVGLGVLAGVFCGIYAVMEAVDGLTRPLADRISAGLLAGVAVVVTTTSVLWFRRRYRARESVAEARSLTPPASPPPAVPADRSTHDATWWWGGAAGLVVTVLLLVGLGHDLAGVDHGAPSWGPTVLDGGLAVLWVVVLVGFLRAPRPARSWPDPLADLHPATARRIRGAARGDGPVPPDLRPTVLAHLQRRRHHAERASWMNAGTTLAVLIDGARSLAEAHGSRAGPVIVLVVGVLGVLIVALEIGSRHRAARRLAALTPSA